MREKKLKKFNRKHPLPPVFSHLFHLSQREKEKTEMGEK